MNKPADQHSDREKPPSPYSDKLDGFKDALECLYIKGNPGGRNIFCKNWPAAVPYVFEEELLRYDREGIKNEEKDRRAELEELSEEKRAAMLALIGEVEEKTVDDGLLQNEFVKKIIDKYGPDMAAYLFSDHILERFLADRTAEGA